MRILIELGRLFLAGAARSAGRKLLDAGDRLQSPHDADAHDEVFVPHDEPGASTVSEEAHELVAAYAPLPDVVDSPPPEGSLAARGRQIGVPWVR